MQFASKIFEFKEKLVYDSRDENSVKPADFEKHHKKYRLYISIRPSFTQIFERVSEKKRNHLIQKKLTIPQNKESQKADSSKPNLIIDLSKKVADLEQKFSNLGKNTKEAIETHFEDIKLDFDKKMTEIKKQVQDMKMNQPRRSAKSKNKILRYFLIPLIALTSLIQHFQKPIEQPAKPKEIEKPAIQSLPIAPKKAAAPSSRRKVTPAPKNQGIIALIDGLKELIKLVADQIRKEEPK